MPEGRIRPLSIDKSAGVDTAWGFGRTDLTAIWFIPCVGREYRLNDYYESSGAAVHHYVEVLLEKRLQNRWSHGAHCFCA
jgi:hypothetical protein